MKVYNGISYSVNLVTNIRKFIDNDNIKVIKYGYKI